MIRYRAGLPGAIEVQLASRAEFQQVLMNERQVELFNEGYRVFDTRRWGFWMTMPFRITGGLNVGETEPTATTMKDSLKS